MRGLTHKYLRVEITRDDSLANTVVPVGLASIEGMDEGECIIRGEVAR